jgi:hypothetical protein
MPRRSRSGSRSQRLTSRPRAGHARSNTGACRAMTFRERVSSGSASTAPMNSGLHPRALAMAGARRRFRSNVASVSCISEISDFTSTTTSARSLGSQASTSIDPRSPAIANVCSGSASQPHAPSLATSSRTRSACLSSRSFASSAPRQRGSRGSETPTVRATRRTSLSEASSSPPLSTCDTIAWLTPAAIATSTWRKPRRMRTARMTRPTCKSFMPCRMNARPYRQLIGRSPGPRTGGRLSPTNWRPITGATKWRPTQPDELAADSARRTGGRLSPTRHHHRPGVPRATQGGERGPTPAVRAARA